MSVKKRDIVKYTMLPGLLPRTFALMTSGFAHTAYLIAVIYQSLRLLPAAHPYINPANIGHFGIRHVIAEAANNLVFDRKNIDQILIFFIILTGLVLLLSQFVLLGVAIVSQPALAALSTGDVFSVSSQYSPSGDHPAQDLAFIILDRVFGTENIFNSCVSDTNVDCTDLRDNPVSSPAVYPMPFHTALHSLLRFYSMGIFIVSVFVIIYFVISIAAETAATGTPFGQRFNKTWVPIRLIVFFALLVPLNIGGTNAGLNSAQLITFWTAKFGSNFATNAWGRFNSVLTDSLVGSNGFQDGEWNYIGREDELVATPNIPRLDSLMQFVFTAMACKVAEEAAYEGKKQQIDDDGNVIQDGITPYLVRLREDNGLLPNNGRDYLKFLESDYDQAKLFANNGSLTIAIGVLEPQNPDSEDHPGQVIPYCGEVQIQVIDHDASDATDQSGADALQNVYFVVLQDMMKDTLMYSRAQCIVARIYQKVIDPGCDLEATKAFNTERHEFYKNYIRQNIQPVIDLQIANGSWDVDAILEAKGWAGASLWYNRIAEMNGDIANAVANIPSVSKYPDLLEYIRLKRSVTNENVPADSAFDPVLDNGEAINFKRDSDAQIAPAMYAAFKAWADKDLSTDNFFIRAINWLFGTSGIFDMRSNADIHPLAQLSSLGKSMMEAAIRNLSAGTPLSFLDGKVEDPFLSALGIGGSFLKVIGTTTLAMSFVLYYVLPFLPFIYFIFAVSGWIKSIFEAIVAMPLWALAHISRIDGEGLPGPAATNGYFLLLEIFLRPILILFGLLASIFIYSALVKVLNDGLFDLVISNVGGYDKKSAADLVKATPAPGPGAAIQEITNFVRGPIDQFFFTVMYVIVVYMMGLSCFKLIDLIPNNILRWAGVTVSTFQEGAGDPAGQVVQKTYSGSLLATNQVKGGALAAL